jgi:hypothetical protein
MSQEARHAEIAWVGEPIRVGGYPTRSPAPRRPSHISGGLASGGPVITVAGELDVVAAPAVEACFEVFEVCHAPRLIVDVARLSF